MLFDLEIVRTILLKAEETPVGVPLSDISGDQAKVLDHVRLLIDGGYIEGVVSDTAGYRIHRLTWDGHSLCELVNDDRRWNEQAIATIKQLGKHGDFSLLGAISKHIPKPMPAHLNPAYEKHPWVIVTLSVMVALMLTLISS